MLEKKKEREPPGYNPPMQGKTTKPRQQGSGMYPHGHSKKKLEKNRQKQYKRTRRRR